MDQLRLLYENKGASIIFGNCANLVYLYSTDIMLLQRISAMCGLYSDELTGAKHPLMSMDHLRYLNKDKGEVLLLLERARPFVGYLPDISAYPVSPTQHVNVCERERQTLNPIDFQEIVNKQKRELMEKKMAEENGKSKSDEVLPFGCEPGEMELSVVDLNKDEMNGREKKGTPIIPPEDIDRMIAEIDRKIAQLEEEERLENDQKMKRLNFNGVMQDEKGNRFIRFRDGHIETPKTVEEMEKAIDRRIAEIELDKRIEKKREQIHKKSNSKGKNANSRKNKHELRVITMCSSSVVRLRGEHVDLCTFRRDTEAILKYTEWVNNPDFNCFIGKNNAVAGYEEEEKWAKSERGFIFNITDKDGLLLGNATIKQHNRNAFLGILIGESEHWNKGYGTETIKLMLEYCFDELNCHRVGLTLNSENSRAKHCYEKAGLKECGRDHESLWSHGHWQDLVRMEILEQDFRRLCVRRSNEEATLAEVIAESFMHSDGKDFAIEDYLDDMPAVRASVDEILDCIGSYDGILDLYVKLFTDFASLLNDNEKNMLKRKYEQNFDLPLPCRATDEVSDMSEDTEESEQTKADRAKLYEMLLKAPFE